MGKDETSVDQSKFRVLIQTPTFWGWLLTFTVLMGIFIYYQFYPNAFDSLKSGANNFGDFIAGTAGSLALVWLIVGYFLQGQELKQNTNALQDQKKELGRQVKELSEQVKATNKMADSMLRMAKSNETLVSFYELIDIKQKRENIEKVKPIFRSGQGQSGGPKGQTYKVENAGNSVNNLILKVENSEVKYNESVMPFFDNGDQMTMEYLATKQYI